MTKDEQRLEHPEIFEKIEELLQRKVSVTGGSGLIRVPRKFIGQDAQVIIWKKEVEDKG